MYISLVCSFFFSPSVRRASLTRIHEAEEGGRPFSFLFPCKTRRYCIRRRNLMSGCIITDDSIQTWKAMSEYKLMITQLWWYFCVLEKATSIENSLHFHSSVWLEINYKTLRIGTKFLLSLCLREEQGWSSSWTITHVCFMFIYTVYH